MKYRRGDRVRVYGTVSGGSLPYREFAYYLAAGKAATVEITGGRELEVKFDASPPSSVAGYTATAHPRQCRKLRKKKRQAKK